MSGKKPAYPVDSCIDRVARLVLDGKLDDSPTSIRSTINEMLHAAARDGFRVNHGYDQERAIAHVRRIVKTCRRIGV